MNRKSLRSWLRCQRLEERNVPSGSAGGVVWRDLNGNGQHDAGEPGLSHVVVRLLNEAGTVVESTETAADGTYHFDTLVPGTPYVIQVVIPDPSAWQFTPPNQG